MKGRGYLLCFYVLNPVQNEVKFYDYFLSRSIGDLVTQSLADLGLYYFTFKDRPQRLVTFETFDENDEETQLDQHFDNV